LIPIKMARASNRVRCSRCLDEVLAIDPGQSAASLSAISGSNGR
jgi:hypothetical protein